MESNSGPCFTDVESWRKRLQSYIENEDDDLNADEWNRLKKNLQEYYHRDSTAQEAIEALKILKTARWKIKASVEEIFCNDVEIEVQKTVKNLVDEVAVVVEGGKPFERVGIDWSCPYQDEEFSQELYGFCSAGKILPDAERVPWLPIGEKSTKSLPRDIVKRLVTPIQSGGIEEQEDWEYSATHPLTDEQAYALFEPTYQCFRKNLKDILTDEVQKYSSNVSTTEAIDSTVVQVAVEKIKSGNIDVDFKSHFIVPYEVNQCKLVPVRDDNEGNIVTYKEVLKPGSERIVDKHLRSDPTLWTDPERPAGPKIREFGWEPLADTEDLSLEGSEAVKKRENIEAFTTDTLSESVLEGMKNRIQTLKSGLGKLVAEEETVRKIAHPQLKDRLEQDGQRFGIVPEQFQSPQEFLDALALPHLLAKDADLDFPLNGEIVRLDDDWLGFDGEGTHEQLTEEQYWKQLRSFKKPASAVLVDWKAILNQDALNDLDDSEDEELKRYFEDVSKTEAAKSEELEQEQHPEEDGDLQMGEKDTPARKRALDKEFVREWVSKFGCEDGIQGLDPKNFKPPVHLVSSDEYEEKFLTHPYTSPYVFYPNFVRFRRMTRNHPTYSEYAFEKLDPAESLDPKSNLDEFKSILAKLETDGPSTVDGPRLIDEKNMGVDVTEAKKWDAEFSSRMAEGLSRLESYAQEYKDEFEMPETPCKEETAADLLFSKVKKYEIPDVHKDFHVKPFTLEDFNSLGSIDYEKSADGQVGPVNSTEGKDSEDKSDDEVEPVRKNVPWRPFKTFSGYDDTDVVQLLSNAAQLIETSVPKRVLPPPRVVEWLNGKYQPSTSRLKKWRKMYGSLFPEVDGPMRTPYLFLSKEEKLERLKKLGNVSIEEDMDDPWKLTEEEKTAMTNNSTKKEDNLTEDDADVGGQEKIVSLEERLGLDGRPTKRTQWAEELDSSEAPDMSVLGTPAMIFPFELDNFQKQAIMALENGYNVFVSAHTSAGKTAVAEYAIAMSRKRRSRCIYTSPIKALSNQKYKDFKRNFDTVGLITGDVQLNESSDCLIMTTEILRSMLYNSSEGIRDLEFVVLDEVHYMNDRERGHVWEEVLILLPANVQIVMLSATVPNTMEFASWVGRLKQRKVMVCRTQHRPVPLMHYFYVDVSSLKNVNPSVGRFLLKEGDKPLDKSEWEEIRLLMEKVGKAARDDRKNFLQNSGDGGHRQKFHGQQQQQNVMKTHGTGPNSNELMKFYAKKERQHWIKFIKHLKDIDWLPTIVFAFSRKTCDELADLVDLDLTTPEEKLRIVAFIKSQVNLLQPEDQNLPQVNTLKKHLKRGIGVHHSGILPVLKEIVEVLFQDGIVRLLFATETFAMGVNMPARTVVFNSINKFDGGELRFLLPAEYIQMAGRAGRRDKDTFGNVIIRSPTRERDRESLTIGSIESMMTGSPSTLTSQFRVSYRMILSTLTARSQISAVNMMARSYHENKAQQKLYLHKDDLRSHEELETKQRILVHSRLKKEEVDNFVYLYEGLKTLSTLWHELRALQIKTNRFARETSIGKFIKFHCGPVVEKVGVVVRSSANPPEYVVISLQDFDRVALLEDSSEDKWAQLWYNLLYMLPFPPPVQGKAATMDQDTRLLVYNIQATDIVEVYKESHPLTEEKVNVILRDLNLSRMGGKTKSDSELESLCYRLYTASSFKPVDEVSFARESDFELYQMMKTKEKSVHALANEMIENLSRQEFIEKLGLVFKWMEIAARKRNLGQLVSEETMSLYPEYTNKMEVLKTMKYVVDDSVQMKGYMAARISKFELVVTEMLTRNVIKDLTPEEVAGLMSFIVYQARVRKPSRDIDEEADEDDEDGISSRPLLMKAIENTKMIIQEIQDEEADKSTHSEELDNLETAFDLVNVMYSWASGMTFNSVVKMAKDSQEGILVRWIQQLVEALKDIESAARVMGDPAVPEKIQASIKAIRRGIVFAPSLYTTL